MLCEEALLLVPVLASENFFSYSAVVKNSTVQHSSGFRGL